MPASWQKNVTLNKLMIITGCSGAGKHTAMAAFEDAGYYCIDNMPVALLSGFVELLAKDDFGARGFAFVMDLREPGFPERCRPVFQGLRDRGLGVEILFLEAEDDVLLQRFSQTRHPHPVSHSRRLIENISAEKALLQPLKRDADRVIDTSCFSVHNLRAVIGDLAEKQRHGAHMRVQVLSFGFKYGIPIDADLIVDVRFLDNPYFVPDLRDLNGRSADIREYLFALPETSAFLERYLGLLDFLMPLYQKEGKRYLTVAVGCTGGRHRSVAIAEAIFSHLKSSTAGMAITHRDIDR